MPSTQNGSRRAVHPRVCGEHFLILGTGLILAGSSPRVRGTRVALEVRGDGERFIPACAGNTSAAPRSRPAMAVHPRVCGEHSPYLTDPDAWFGSSPRVRGTQNSGTWSIENGRFIPACAGNTLRSRIALVGHSVHPRVCGEHSRGSTAPTPTRGSSPRVRGTLGRRACKRHRIRFIPACAGNTRTAGCCAGSNAVHPRVCGEHSCRQKSSTLQTGSSPRVRGTLNFKHGGIPLFRFIPACAGNTPKGQSRISNVTVHPRVCGEHKHSNLIRRIRCGSSPRVRGTLRGCRRAGRLRRFIPACAGNTFLAPMSPMSVTVHPRVCGEHFASFI